MVKDNSMQEMINKTINPNDPVSVALFNQNQLIGKITQFRAEKTNELVKNFVPMWKIYLMRKWNKLSKIFGLYVVINTAPLEEGDIISEILTLYMRKKKLGIMEFKVQDQRVLWNKKIAKVSKVKKK